MAIGRLQEIALAEELGVQWLVGCDEVGRGSLAGPVFACAFALRPLSLPCDIDLLGINDSKKISAAKRRAIIAKIFNKTPAELRRVNRGALPDDWGDFVISAKSARVVEDKNISVASLEAMRCATRQLLLRLPTSATTTTSNKGVAILIDGSQGFDLPQQGNGLLPIKACVPMIKGDSKSLAIALAAIIAKEARDSLMARLGARYPNMGWAKNSAYPTREHRDELKKSGATPHHRKTFIRFLSADPHK